MPEPQTLYSVHSRNTGAKVCGPYESQSDAKRELKRLTREADTGRTARSREHPHGQALTHDGGPVLHVGVPQEYELVTSEGVVLP